MFRRPAATAALVAVLLLAACSASATTSDDGASSTDAAASGSQAQESDGETPAGELPDIETEFPPACDTVTTDELFPIVGNSLSDGSGFTTLICDWSTSQFGGEGSIGYSDAGDIPGAQVGVCVDAGVVLVTVTGGYGAASDEARYTGEAAEVMELVLGRL